jgi:Txe/YoeB family toxin of Txe-Axe toxin-antitoxin module
MKLKPLRKDLMKFLKVHNLEKKWKKVKILFEENIRHPSLHTELLEPHWRGIYSFRVDIKYRALYFIAKGGTAEVFAITKHYKK